MKYIRADNRFFSNFNSVMFSCCNELAMISDISYIINPMWKCYFQAVQFRINCQILRQLEHNKNSLGAGTDALSEFCIRGHSFQNNSLKH